MVRILDRGVDLNEDTYFRAGYGWLIMEELEGGLKEILLASGPVQCALDHFITMYTESENVQSLLG